MLSLPLLPKFKCGLLPKNLRSLYLAAGPPLSLSVYVCNGWGPGYIFRIKEARTRQTKKRTSGRNEGLLLILTNRVAQ